jgi:hypothetical protein
MARAFAITTASDHVTLDAQGHGEVTYTISNTTTRPLRAWPTIKGLGSMDESWLQVVGGGERSFSPGESHQFVVKIKAPADAPTGKYSFRLNVISGSRNVEDESIEGPAASFEVKPAPIPASGGGFPWWLVAVTGVIVLVGALAIVLLIRPKTVPVPDLVGMQLNAATNLLVATNLGFNIHLEVTGTNPAMTVYAQDPEAGGRIKPGTNSIVTLQVERETATVRVPNVSRNLTLQAAINQLQKAGLNVGQINQRIVTNTNSLDRVMDQDPKAEEMAAPNSTVALFIGVRRQLPPRDFKIWTEQLRVEPKVFQLRTNLVVPQRIN